MTNWLLVVLGIALLPVTVGLLAVVLHVLCGLPFIVCVTPWVAIWCLATNRKEPLWFVTIANFFCSPRVPHLGKR